MRVTDELSPEQLAAGLPGTADLMVLVGDSWWRCAHAARGGNWPLAAFYARRVRSVQRRLAIIRPKYAERLAAFEATDAADEDRALARLDVLAALVTVLLYAVSSGLRVTDLGAAAASPGATVAALAGLIVLLIDGVIASTLYSSREWAVLDEEEYQPRRHQKRRRAS